MTDQSPLETFGTVIANVTDRTGCSKQAAAEKLLAELLANYDGDLAANASEPDVGSGVLTDTTSGTATANADVVPGGDLGLDSIDSHGKDEPDLDVGSGVL